MYQNLFSLFSISRHLGSFLFVIIINDAVVNILVQEIFLWVSDNFRRRNSQKGNYRVSDLLCGTSLLTDAWGGEGLPSHPTPLTSGWPVLTLRPELESL